jgi:hypothetical protein
LPDDGVFPAPLAARGWVGSPGSSQSQRVNLAPVAQPPPATDASGQPIFWWGAWPANATPANPPAQPGPYGSGRLESSNYEYQPRDQVLPPLPQAPAPPAPPPHSPASSSAACGARTAKRSVQFEARDEVGEAAGVSKGASPPSGAPPSVADFAAPALASLDALPDDDEPVFWELALVWSLSKNEVQKRYKLQGSVVSALREQQLLNRVPDVGESSAACRPWHAAHEWWRHQRDDWLHWKATLLDPLADDMLSSPTWREVRAALLGARLSVRLLRSKDADEFFMVVGAPLSRLQEEAERRCYELRLRRSVGDSQKPAQFFVYSRQHDAHYERFLCSGEELEAEEGESGAVGEGEGGAVGADEHLEKGQAQAPPHFEGPALASMERQRLIDGLMANALLENCAVNMTQLRNMRNACTDTIYLHDDIERLLIERVMGSDESGWRVPRPVDLRHHKLTSLEKPRRYFGEQVCFYFAFLRFYTRALLFPAVFGTATYVVYWVRPDIYLLLVPAFCLLLMIWSATFIEQWKRREATLRHIWDMDEYAEQEEERIGFRGRIEQGIYTVHGHWVPIDNSDLAVLDVELVGPKVRARTHQRRTLDPPPDACHSRTRARSRFGHRAPRAGRASTCRSSCCC